MTSTNKSSESSKDKDPTIHLPQMYPYRCWKYLCSTFLSQNHLRLRIQHTVPTYQNGRLLALPSFDADSRNQLVTTGLECHLDSTEHDPRGIQRTVPNYQNGGLLDLPSFDADSRNHLVTTYWTQSNTILEGGEYSQSHAMIALHLSNVRIA